jgi:hypothetical protein
VNVKVFPLFVAARFLLFGLTVYEVKLSLTVTENFAVAADNDACA